MSGILGLCVGDAIGVPAEFINRESLKPSPVTDMRGHGTHNQPPGTWSDDTSMALCTMDSLSNGLDYADMMRRFLSWMEKGEYTPHGEMFDIGISTRKALQRFAMGTEPLKCGGASENDNGNGSLMRILPLIFYLKSLYGDHFTENNEAFDIIHNISSLTHAHKRSQIACGIYLSVANELSGSNHSVGYGVWKACKHYGSRSEFAEELIHFQRIFSDDYGKLSFANQSQDEIRSSGYVVDTLEAAIWCLLNSDSYESCVLKAVNLGDDTDTVAAVAGGLAGLRYGVDAIPEKWLSQIFHLDYIKGLCEAYNLALQRIRIKTIT
jgi:ADP-ribosylglycohydrolase